jgi:2',3'-cyclic-nucleotide 2'-phosphodiesterase (5'-nucleotidase family)
MVNTTVVGQQKYYYNNYNQNAPVYNNNNNVQRPAVNAAQGKYPYSPSALNNDTLYTFWKNPNATPATQGDAVLSILHMNDNHRKVSGLTKFKTAFDQIAAKVKAAGTDLVKVHSGDYNAGLDQSKLRLQIQLLNELGIDYAALGNHEFDIGPEKMAKELTRANFVSLAANLVIPQNTGIPELHQIMQNGKLVNSTIFETNGNKYGMIGLTPPDLKARSDASTNFHGIDVMNTDQTIQQVQKEVNKLKAQGINKILLVSHVGLDIDKRIAQETDGVDVILGGHSHDLLNPLEPGVSLLNSKANEPVLVFQNGKNAQYFGVTDATFDQNGIVKAAVSRQENADKFESAPQLSGLQDQILGKSPVIGQSTGRYTSSGVKLRENPIANFVADAIRAKTGADIALFQSWAVRDTIKQGPITERDIDELLPFIDSQHVSRITGQDVIDALNHGAHTYLDAGGRPGILQVSGLKYNINVNGQVDNVLVQQPNGSYAPINPNQEYNVAYDQFLIKGAEGFTSLAKPTSVIKAFMEANADIVKEYIRSQNGRPIVMQTENRITIQAADPTANKAKPKALLKAQVPYVSMMEHGNNQQVKTQPQQKAPQIQPDVAFKIPRYPLPSTTPPYYNPVMPLPQYPPHYGFDPYGQQRALPTQPFSATR